jgi:hypothetical protein
MHDPALLPFEVRSGVLRRALWREFAQNEKHKRRRHDLDKRVVKDVEEGVVQDIELEVGGVDCREGDEKCARNEARRTHRRHDANLHVGQRNCRAASRTVLARICH